MRKETTANKLLALLGIEDKVEVPDEFKDSPESKKKIKEKAKHNKFYGVSEDEIQATREAQGIIYFLQAPELFSAKTCPHCGERFLVSRQFVSHCSYTCIRLSLEEIGIVWSKGEDLEALALDPHVYEGNEPIWIRNLPKLRSVLDSLEAQVNNESTVSSGV